MVKIKLQQAYNIVDKCFLENGIPIASPSQDYTHIWLRDAFYQLLPFKDKDCGRYEKGYHAILDMFKYYEWKLDENIRNKPKEKWGYIHARYDLNFREIPVEWGHKQNDNIGEILFGIGEGIKAGRKIIRDNHDIRIIQKLVWYLESIRYWEDADSGIWEEWEEIRASSVGACVAGLKAVEDIVSIPNKLINYGYNTLFDLFLVETKTRSVDLAQMSLIYPFKLIHTSANSLIDKIEFYLLKERGVIRYKGDSYYSLLEKKFGRGMPLEKYYGTEAEWTFGLPWLALCHMEKGNYDKAKKYIDRTEEIMLEDGGLPELYYAHTDIYNINTPLGWSNAMYILAKEKYLRVNNV